MQLSEREVTDMKMAEYMMTKLRKNIPELYGYELEFVDH